VRLRFFAVTIQGGDEIVTERNQFLGAHRTLWIDRDLVTESGHAMWAIRVSHGAAPWVAALILFRPGDCPRVNVANGFSN
jgi:hypothetical protein